MKPDRAEAKGRLLLAAIEFAKASRSRDGSATDACNKLCTAALEYERQMTPETVAYVRKRARRC